MREPIPYPQNSKFWGSRYVNKIFDRADASNDGIDATQSSPVNAFFRGAANLAGVSGRIIATAYRSWFAARPVGAAVYQIGTKAIALPAGETRETAASLFLVDDQDVPRSVAYPIWRQASPRQRPDGSLIVDAPVDLATDSPYATQFFIPATVDRVDVWEKGVVMPGWAVEDVPVIFANRVTRLVLEPRRTVLEIAVAFSSVAEPVPIFARQSSVPNSIGVNTVDQRLVFSVLQAEGSYIQYIIAPITADNRLALIEIQAA